MVTSTLANTPVQADDGIWDPAYVGSDPTVLYLPDANAVYWRYGWKRTPGDQTGVIVRGQMPDARYFGYNVYDDNTKSSLGSFTDFALKTEDGGVNPFTGQTSDSRSNYVLHILPEGAKTSAKNVLYFPDNLTDVSFMLRHYLPEGGNLGNVPMPSVSMLNVDSGKTSKAVKSVPVPALSAEEAKRYLLPVLKEQRAALKENPMAVLQALKAKEKDGSFDMKQVVAKQVVSKTFSHYTPGTPAESYRFQTSGTYPNNDNIYLVMPIVRDNNDVLMVQFRQPKPPATPAEYPTSDVRYFSLSQGDELTYNFATTIDSDMKVKSDGLIHFVIADDNPENRSKADALGANFMPWKVRDKMLLVYRHMLPRADFKYGIDKVPSFDPDKPKYGQEGRAYIADYAPVGVVVQETVYRELQAVPKF